MRARLWPRPPGPGSSKGRVSRSVAGRSTREGRSTTPACQRARWWRACRADRGYEAGYADGQRDAEAAARDAEREGIARVDSALAALCDSVNAARSAYEERSTQLESAVPRFAFELLEALFGRESVLAVDPGREAVARALALDEGTLPAVARLSPEDADTIGDLVDLSTSRPVTVVADPMVERGGAVVEIGSTTIDSQLSRALERMRAVIVGHPEGDPR